MDNLRKIVFVADGDELVLPITPAAFELGHGIRIETVNIHGLGDIRVAGYTTLDTISLDAFFPANKYPFALTELVDPYELVNRFKAWADAQTICRWIVTGTDINIPVLIESIRYGERDGSNDVYFTLTLSEYRYVSVSPSRSVSTKKTRTVSTAPATPKTYTVVSGDTLRNIARHFYGDSSKYTAIATANGISNPNVIRVGTVLTIP
jgi:LysM repeat protein